MKFIVCFIVVGAFSFQMGCAKSSDSGGGETELTKKLYTLFDAQYCHPFVEYCDKLITLKYISPLKLNLTIQIYNDLPHSYSTSTNYTGSLNCTAAEPLVCSNEKAKVIFAAKLDSASVSLVKEDGSVINESLDMPGRVR